MNHKASHHAHHSEHTHHLHEENPSSGHPPVQGAQVESIRPKAKPSHDDVVRKAYEIYLQEGCPQGRALQHWLMAEAHLNSSRSKSN